MAVQHDATPQARLQVRPEPVAQSPHARTVLGQRRARDPARLAESDDVGHVLGSRASARFLAGAVDERLEPYAVANVEGADALRRVHLVPRQREQVGAQCCDINSDLARRLSGVDVDEHASFARKTLTRSVGARSARSSAARSMTPCRSTSTTTRLKPSRSTNRAASCVAGCSTALITTCCPARSGVANAAPLIAWLVASVPPLVKTISSGSAPRSRATSPRASSTAVRARTPCSWALDGLPKHARKYGSIASTTAGSIGVVAL